MTPPPAAPEMKPDPPPGRPPEHGPQRPPITGRKAMLLTTAFVAVAVLVAILGIVPRLRARTTLQQQTAALAAPDVLVARPRKGTVSQEVVLPGNIQAFTDSPIYARTSGYLKSWAFDIGAHVRKGQRLAVIESPEIDQQLVQAEAEVATAKANALFAETQSARYQKLLEDNAVSSQDTDNFKAQAASTNNQVQSATANVRRLRQLTAFENVEAPFSGVITARNVDVGTLIDAGAGKELFHLAADDTLRVYVNVPQRHARACVPGVKAGLTLGEYPGRIFEGKIVRTANAIDPTSRTLLVEIDVDNGKHELFPGAYAQVHLGLGGGEPTLVLSVSTLIFRSEGLRVGVVKNGKATLRPISIARDDGRTVEVSSGLGPDDEVIQNPPDSLIDGESVQVVEPEAENPGAALGPPREGH